MKRDWDVIREILLKTEELIDKNDLTLANFPNNRHHEIGYHVEIMREAGLVEAILDLSCGEEATDFFLQRLTWEGHELLDSIRNNNTWTKIKSIILNKGSSLGLEIIKVVAIDITKNHLK